jgi:uncharacterized protein YdaU (DUF1376 family)
MAKPGITYVENGEWKNRVQDSSRAANKHTKAAAEKAGRKDGPRPQGRTHHQDQDGTIGEKNSYGNDPRKVPG